MLARHSTILITGASAGIGAACARRFADDGCRLVLCARREDRLRALADTLDVETHCLVADVRDREALHAAIADLPPSFAEVDVLVNNAGLALGLAPFWEAKPEHLDTMIETNVLALVHVTRALLPGMVARRRGHVVHLGSIAGNWPYPGGHVYCATKAFVRQFALALRADLLGTPVRMTNIEPGLVETEFSRVRFEGDEERAASVYANTQALSAEDIAEIVHFCTRQPPHVNINTLEVMPVTQAFGPSAIARTPPGEPPR